jgi:hypothetical protein
MDCLQKHLLAGPGLEITPTCIVGGTLGVITGNPFAVFTGYAACLTGIAVELSCHEQALGRSVPEPPEDVPAEPSWENQGLQGIISVTVGKLITEAANVSLFELCLLYLLVCCLG